MEKPVSIILTETKQGIAHVINNAKLSPIILLPIVKEIYEELSALAEEQYQKDLKEYNASLEAQQDGDAK